jgi:hypothetical protein
MGNIGGFERVNYFIARLRVSPSPQQFGRACKIKLGPVGMNFCVLETLHERDIAIGATRETGTILGFAVRTEHSGLE